MATVKTFQDLEVWKKARILTQEVYSVTKKGGFAKDYALRDQLRNACISIMANIAEGFERGGNKEFSQFLSIAKASAGEACSHLCIALDQAYLTKDEFEIMNGMAQEIGRMTKGLMKYLSETNIKGSKYK